MRRGFNVLTPVQRLRQAEPSWLRSGQTTTLFSSLTEKEPVKGARGGMASIGHRILGETVRGGGGWEQRDGWPSMAVGELWNTSVKLQDSSRSSVSTL